MLRTATTVIVATTMRAMNRISVFKVPIVGCCTVAAVLGFVVSCSAQQGDTAVGANPVQISRKPSQLPRATADGLTSVPEDLAKIKLCPGMLLRLSVYDAPEMASTLRVSEDGSLMVPLAGRIPVAGLLLIEAQAKIRAALIAGEFFVDPQVNLDIAQLTSRFISVLGEVQSPGKFEAYGPLSLQAVLALAGGETIDAGAEIEIQRASPGHPVERIDNEKKNIQEGFGSVVVNPGDVITVERAGIIYVLGAVHRPGGYLMVNRGQMDVLEALAVAGGTMLEAATDSIRIIHRSSTLLTEQNVKLNSLTEVKTGAPVLHDNDILYVPSSKTKSVFVNGAVIIGAAASSLVYRAP